MKRVFFVLVFYVAFMGGASAQTLKKYAIDKSGCAANFFCNPGKFELSHSPDSSKVYTGECITGGVTYDLICVQMKERIIEITDAEAVLVQYLDYLKSSFQVTGSTGYMKGLRLKGKEHTRGISDQWTDKENNIIKVKGWTDSRFIAVLIMISAKEIKDAQATSYLDGIVFPEVKKK